MKILLMGRGTYGIIAAVTQKSSTFHFHKINQHRERNPYTNNKLIKDAPYLNQDKTKKETIIK